MTGIPESPDADGELLAFLADHWPGSVPEGTRVYGWQTIGRVDVFWVHFGGEKTPAALVLDAGHGRPAFKRYVPRSRHWYPATLPHRLTGLAAIIAGRSRARADGEWKAHLGGNTGYGLPRATQLRLSLGFIRAAVRYRLQDAADAAWRPADAILASRALSGLAVVMTALPAALMFLVHGGLYSVLSNLENISVAAVFTYSLVRFGRKWRGVRPSEHEPRRSRK